MRRSTVGRTRERAVRELAHLGVRRVRGREAESPQGAAPAVVETGLVGPRTAGVVTVVAEPVGRDRAGHEEEQALLQCAQGGAEARLAAEDDESACLVVDAVAVLRSRDVVVRVLEQAVLVAEGEEVVEDGGAHPVRDGHAAGRETLSWLTTSR